MIKIHINPPSSDWAELTRRAESSDADITARVEDILRRVREGGDRAIREIEQALDAGQEIAREVEGLKIDTPAGAETSPLQASEADFVEAEKQTPQDLKDAIEAAARNIRRFHEAQKPQEIDIVTAPGVRCVQRAVPIQRVGLYIPGGTAPLFSTVLMLAIPARVAGCPEIVMCTPTGQDGKIAPPILYAARLCGVDRVFKAGGAQAVAAMAYGTESVPRVDKIFGPGNRFVTRAKQLVSVSDCAIDMPAGPSEVLVMAEKGVADPAFAAADMLSQAEHGPDSQAILVADSADFAAEVNREIEAQLAALTRRDTAEKSLKNSRIIVLPTRGEMADFANAYAAEHLIIQMREPWQIAEKIAAAGSVFIGNWSPESAGDYASGTNHTLPTAGWARSFGGVNLDSFMRKTTFQELTKNGLDSLAETIITMANAEGLQAHANAVELRIKNEPTEFNT